jgi:hypothetical protein
VEAEHRQCLYRFAPASRAPSLPLGRTDAKATLEPALGPRIVVAVGRKNDVDDSTCSERRLDQFASRERLVVRMGRKDDESIVGAKSDRCRHRSSTRVSSNIGNALPHKEMKRLSQVRIE